MTMVINNEESRQWKVHAKLYMDLKPPRDLIGQKATSHSACVCSLQKAASQGRNRVDQEESSKNNTAAV